MVNPDQPKTFLIANRHLQVRYNQKMAKYGHIAKQNRFQFIPVIFSHTRQIYAAFKDLLGEQIRHKIIAFEGQAKSSKINSAMKWRSKCISMVIAKTASRNVAFKAAKMGESVLAGQSDILISEVATTGPLLRKRTWKTYVGRNMEQLHIFKN